MPLRRSAASAVDPDARYWETRVARNGRGGQLDTIANTLKAEAGETGLGDAAPMVVYNVTPESGQGAHLRAVEAELASAVTVTEHERKTDRGIRIVTDRAYEVDKERGIPNPEGIRVNATDTSPTITALGDPTERTDRGLRVVSPAGRHTAVRRLTPTECERLQGFPDGWSIVDPLPPKRGKK